MDGVSNTYEGGWWDQNWKQMGYQLAAACTCALWSFTISCILLYIINKIPGCHIRESEEDELKGLDFKYLHDVDLEAWERTVERAGQMAIYGGITPRGADTPPQGAPPASKEDVALTKRD